MFYDPGIVSATKVLQDSYIAIREELDTLLSTQFVKWPEHSLYTGDWTVFGFYGFGRRLHENCQLCPRTAAIVDSIPDKNMAGFSKLAAGTRIGSHCGRPKSQLRCHLALKIPAGDVGLRVGPEVRRWTEGECLLFDDTKEHEAWNLAEEDRIVLLVDVQKPVAA